MITKEKIMQAVEDFGGFNVLANEDSVINIAFKDSQGYDFVYGIIMRDILDTQMLIGGIWGTGVYTYINMEDIIDDEDAVDIIEQHLIKKGDMTEIVDIKLLTEQ